MIVLYRSRVLYHGLMSMVYHIHRRERFEEVARWVPEGADLLDVCCGDGSLAAYLPATTRYRGLDLSEAFVAAARRRGREVRAFNLMREPLPRARVVVCQVSLFQFYPRVEEVVSRLFEAATERLIISESVKSFSQSQWSFVSSGVAWGTRVDGLNDGRFRFNPDALQGLFAPYKPHLRHIAEICGGRDWVYVLDKQRPAPAQAPRGEG